MGCEIAPAEFCFVDGVRKTYHQFINPGDIPTGYAFEATRHAAHTHRIPLPPDSFGSVSAIDRIPGKHVALSTHLFNTKLLSSIVDIPPGD
jgi:hypothetical protein